MSRNMSEQVQVQELAAGLKSRCRDVFNFEHVKTKEPPRKKPDSKEQPTEAEAKAVAVAEAEAEAEAVALAKADLNAEAKQRKGQESLFRVPDADFRLAGKKAPRALYEPPKRERAQEAAETADRREEDAGHRRASFGKRAGHAPDFKANPSKYTKYTLKDVDNVNNRSNTAAAFDFLREVREREGGPVEERFQVDSGQKIVFKKREKREEEEEESSFPQEGFSKVGSSKITEKEEETAPKKDKKKTKKDKKKSPAMSLSHLMDEQEEEEED